VPGNTIIAPAKKELKIDFVESSFKNPTQCTALTLDDTLVKIQLNEFNEVLYKGPLSKNIDLSDSAVFLYNNEELVSIQQKITAIAASNDPFKEIHVKILLKELVLCVLKMKHLKILNADALENTNTTPFAAIINFIHQNIYNNISIEDLLKVSCMSKSTFYRAFVNQLGISPYQLIINERLKIAKKLLLNDKLSVKETAYASGFSSPNYFIRLFKKHEGITPKEFVNTKLNKFL
jgi:AraC-like DNA-binding protein